MVMPTGRSGETNRATVTTGELDRAMASGCKARQTVARARTSLSLIILVTSVQCGPHPTAGGTPNLSEPGHRRNGRVFNRRKRLPAALRATPPPHAVPVGISNGET